MEKLEINNCFKKSKDLFFKIFVEGNQEKEDAFGKKDLINILSPGRVNIIGEHYVFSSSLRISKNLSPALFSIQGRCPHSFNRINLKSLMVRDSGSLTPR